MNEQEFKARAEEVVEKIKESVKKGNAARVLVKKEETVVLNVPLNAGVAGTVLGLALAPWALIVTAIVTVGMDCRVELEKTDGEVVELLSRETGRKAVAFGAEVVEQVKSSFHKE